MGNAANSSESGPTRPLDGFFVSLGCFDAPVDAAAGDAGSTWILEHSGLLHRLAPRHHAESRSPRTLGLGSQFVEAGFSPDFGTFALHPGFADPRSTGRGTLFVSVTAHPTASGPGSPSTRHEGVHEVRLPTDGGNGLGGSPREVVRLPGSSRSHPLITGLCCDASGRLYIGVRADERPIAAITGTSAQHSLLGAILRVDPLRRDDATGYGIPGTNPFANSPSARAEIWSRGVREPHLFSCDPIRQDVVFADTLPGGSTRLQVSRAGGEHFGWRQEYSPGTDRHREESPLLDLSPNEGRSRLAGAFLYRGERFPALAGRYLVATRDGRLFSLSTEPANGVIELVPDAPLGRALFSMRPGGGGEPVFLCKSGEVFGLEKRIPACADQETLVCSRGP